MLVHTKDQWRIMKIILANSRGYFQQIAMRAQQVGQIMTLGNTSQAQNNTSQAQNRQDPLGRSQCNSWTLGTCAVRNLEGPTGRAPLHAKSNMIWWADSMVPASGMDSQAFPMTWKQITQTTAKPPNIRALWESSFHPTSLHLAYYGICVIAIVLKSQVASTQNKYNIGMCNAFRSMLPVRQEHRLNFPRVWFKSTSCKPSPQHSFHALL